MNPILTNALDSFLFIPNIFFVLFVFFVVYTAGFRFILEPGRPRLSSSTRKQRVS
jgi:hypothetical protein